PGEDLAMLAACDHVISSTGTFSFWAGWLSKGVVLYYKNFPRKGSPLDKVFQPADAFPEYW
ncbi:hypothetical protein CAPTEDRAFT_49636, partial [Capitella teleta]